MILSCLAEESLYPTKSKDFVGMSVFPTKSKMWQGEREGKRTLTQTFFLQGRGFLYESMRKTTNSLKEGGVEQVPPIHLTGHIWYLSLVFWICLGLS
jgi:hypothetical protein